MKDINNNNTLYYSHLTVNITESGGGLKGRGALSQES